MIFNQYWYTWLFFIPAVFCFIKAANYAMSSRSTQMVWFMTMTAIWSSLIYYNWNS